MANSTFRAAAGNVDVKWSKAGHKSYDGIALIREDAKGTTLGMFRMSAKATAAEYRSLAAAALDLAKLADQCADAAEAAEKDAKVSKLSDAQKSRIAEGLKSMKPKDRVTAMATLALTFDGLTLTQFGYSPETGAAIAEKPPTPPAKPDADAAIANVLGGK